MAMTLGVVLACFVHSKSSSLLLLACGRSGVVVQGFLWAELSLDKDRLLNRTVSRDGQDQLLTRAGGAAR